MTRKRVSEIIDNDVISSSTPLEMEMAGVHPRLHVSATRLEAICQCKDQQPYAGLLASIQHTVDALAERPLLAEHDTGKPVKLANFQAPGVGKREYGDRIYQAAGHYLLSGDTGARDLALDTMRALAAYSLYFGHCLSK